MPRNIVKINAEEWMTFKALPSVKAYFGNVQKGQPEVYDTPFAKGESTEDLLGSWMEVLESKLDSWPTLLEFEKDLAGKVGPMSVMLPLKERMKDIDHYYDDIHLPSEPVDDRAISALKSEWRLDNPLQVREMSKTVKLMKKSTNSGLPYFTKRRNVVDKTLPCDVRDNPNIPIQLLQGKAWKMSAILGWRGQEGGYSKEDVKQRVIWMFPFALNIRELQVYQPLIETAQKLNIVPAWVSMDAVDRKVTDLFDSKSETDLVVCTDFSKFDQHFNEDLQDVARQLIANILRPNQASSDWLQRVFPIKYYIPMMYGVGGVRIGRHGMASGSGGTNADETLAHRALQYEAAQRAGARLNPNSQCLGDDGILSYPGITVDDVVKSYSSHGQEMNVSKQYASTQDCVYLRRWHHKDYRVGGICVGVYSTCRALGRLRYLERFMNPKYWDEKAVALRQLSILENVKYHPLREEFVDFCMKRDKYRLGIDIPGFLANIEVEAKRLIDHIPDFLGYTRTLQAGGDPTGGIASWWIVNYLKSKA